MPLFQLVVIAVCVWLHREQTDLIAFLREENRLLKSKLGRRRLRFEDSERKRLGDGANKGLLPLAPRLLY